MEEGIHLRQNRHEKSISLERDSKRQMQTDQKRQTVIQTDSTHRIYGGSETDCSQPII